jgi:chromosome segregation ATPase
VFEQRREEVEGELAQALQRAQALETSLASSQEEATVLRRELVTRQAEVDALQEAAARARAAAEAAEARALVLEQQLEASRTEAEQRLASAHAHHEQRVTELQSALTAQAQAFRAEIDQATERLEGVQQHVLRQVTEAREATKRVEARLAKASEKNTALAAEVQTLKAKLVHQAEQHDRAQSDLASLSHVANELRREREALTRQLALLTGKLEAQAELMEALERRAVGAEVRLEETLKRPAVLNKRVARSR